ncbi:MAG TPA: aryl-sulfate sulfotransferase [bacterium]|nr:aryl-sulfate sulfotransferase [bacterium]
MTIRRYSWSFAALLVGVALIAGLAGAAPEPWVHPDGSIHYYDAINTPSGINWNVAWDSALGHGGYLATITSQAENNFVFSLIDSARYWYQRFGTNKLAGPWLGGSKYFGYSDPDSGWHWVTNESMGYRNWSMGQPDNQGGSENALHFGESVGVRSPHWDDLSSLDDSIRGFVRELSADSTTVGLRYWDTSAYAGYTLFGNNNGHDIYLIDNNGRSIHRWRAADKTVGALYLLPNGLLSQIGNLSNPSFLNGGRVSLLDWNANKAWSFDYSDSTHCLHHDAIWLPNGHVAAIAWELKTKAQAIAAGRDTTKLTQGKLWSEEVIEVDTATDSIIWQWHIWDHLVQDYDSTKLNYGVVGNHPELIDLNWTTNYSPQAADWIHANALDYDSAFDQIMFSARGFNEIWVLDHGTTTKQAATHTGGRYGHGGDLLYRWGNPQAYRRGDSSNMLFHAQHNCQWIRSGLRGAGDIMVVDNGLQRRDSLYTTIIEFTPPVDSTGHYPTLGPGQRYGPTGPSWQYIATPPTSFYTPQVGSAQRLPNGHTLICEGTKGRFFEIGADSVLTWWYRSPVIDTTPLNQGDTIAHTDQWTLKTIVHRSPRYPLNYAGLQGHDLTPGYPIEVYQTKQYTGLAQAPVAGRVRVGLAARPNPFGRRTAIRFSLPQKTLAAIGIYSVDGRLIRSFSTTGDQVVWDGADNAGRQVARGIYYCRLHGPASSAATKLVKTE